MEHRWSIRTPLKGEVVLTIQPWTKVRASLRDISMGGISVRAEHLDLPINAIVTLAFSLDNHGEASYHRLSGQVVYCDALHTGLVFLNPANETLRILRHLAGVVPHNGVSGFAANR